MPGATLQLVSYGAQDMYLTGNPQITYFKVVYRRHTNFSMEDIIISSMIKPNFGGQVIEKISKIGDLVHKISLIYKAQKVYAGHGLANPTTALIDYVSLVIGGHEIDRQYGHWMEAWYELTKENPNGTCTNITKIDDNSISHMASNLDIAVGYNASFSDFKYFDNRLNKLTNIFGTGVSYPPTKFQKGSRCGGCYCEPTYLHELFIGTQEDGTTINASFSATGSSDFKNSVGTTIADNDGGDGQDSANSASSDKASCSSSQNASKTIKTGSIIGLSILEIPFYCSKDPGLSLPLIAMQNSEVQLDVHFSNVTDADWSETEYNGEVTGDYISNNGTISNPQNCFNAFATSNSTGSTALLKPIKGTNNKINFDIDISVLYIYLDTDERRRFAEVSHEYLIEQVQYLTYTGGDRNIDISTFSHPVKEIIWTGQPYKSDKIKYAESGSSTSPNLDLNKGTNVHKSGVRFQPGNNDNISGGSIKNSSYTLGFGNTGSSASATNYATTETTIFSSDGKFVAGLIGPSTPTCLDDCDWSLSLNDIERTTPQPLQQYTRYNVERYHTGFGSVSCPDSIAIYSFALKPEDHQPSGTCNFSKIDKVMLHRYKGQIQSNDRVNLNIYAVNYNILRVMSGLAALAYTL
jgi:hypothetical protein